jgi:peptidyl-prolyl cis-trans isomerase B (cyclophilin B)
MRVLALTCALSLTVLVGLDAQGRSAAAGDSRVILETAKGTIEIRLFAADAPKSVAHILGLVKRNFYRGLRFHRVEPTLVQFGDPLSRDVSRKGYWGSGGSGNPIGVAEMSKRLTHKRGAVSLAHAGAPTIADSQLFIMKTASPGLDGKHAIIGEVVTGMAVVDKIAVADLIKQVSVK